MFLLLLLCAVVGSSSAVPYCGGPRDGTRYAIGAADFGGRTNASIAYPNITGGDAWVSSYPSPQRIVFNEECDTLIQNTSGVILQLSSIFNGDDVVIISASSDEKTVKLQNRYENVTHDTVVLPNAGDFVNMVASSTHIFISLSNGTHYMIPYTYTSGWELGSPLYIVGALLDGETVESYRIMFQANPEVDYVLLAYNFPGQPSKSSCNMFGNTGSLMYTHAVGYYIQLNHSSFLEYPQTDGYDYMCQVTALGKNADHDVIVSFACHAYGTSLGRQLCVYLSNGTEMVRINVPIQLENTIVTTNTDSSDVFLVYFFGQSMYVTLYRPKPTALGFELVGAKDYYYWYTSRVFISPDNKYIYTMDWDMVWRRYDNTYLVTSNEPTFAPTMPPTEVPRVDDSGNTRTDACPGGLYNNANKTYLTVEYGDMPLDWCLSIKRTRSLISSTSADVVGFVDSFLCKDCTSPTHVVIRCYPTPTWYIPGVFATPESECEYDIRTSPVTHEHRTLSELNVTINGTTAVYGVTAINTDVKTLPSIYEDGSDKKFYKQTKYKVLFAVIGVLVVVILGLSVAVAILKCEKRHYRTKSRREDKQLESEQKKTKKPNNESDNTKEENKIKKNEQEQKKTKKPNNESDNTKEEKNKIKKNEQKQNENEETKTRDSFRNVVNSTKKK